jgi:hypothetical protein
VADYPSIMQAFGTEVVPSDGTVTDRAVSGKARLRSYFTQVRYQIKVVHDLDDTDMATLDSHYTADRLNSFSFTYAADDATYSVRYMAPPRAKPIKGGRWAVTVHLIVV